MAKCKHCHAGITRFLSEDTTEIQNAVGDAYEEREWWQCQCPWNHGGFWYGCHYDCKDIGSQYPGAYRYHEPDNIKLLTEYVDGNL